MEGQSSIAVRVSGTPFSQMPPSNSATGTAGGISQRQKRHITLEFPAYPQQDITMNSSWNQAYETPNNHHHPPGTRIKHFVLPSLRAASSFSIPRTMSKLKSAAATNLSHSRESSSRTSFSPPTHTTPYLLPTSSPNKNFSEYQFITTSYNSSSNSNNSNALQQTAKQSEKKFAHNFSETQTNGNYTITLLEPPIGSTTTAATTASNSPQKNSPQSQQSNPIKPSRLRYVSFYQQQHLMLKRQIERHSSSASCTPIANSAITSQNNSTTLITQTPAVISASPFIPFNSQKNSITALASPATNGRHDHTTTPLSTDYYSNSDIVTPTNNTSTVAANTTAFTTTTAAATTATTIQNPQKQSTKIVPALPGGSSNAFDRQRFLPKSFKRFKQAANPKMSLQKNVMGEEIKASATPRHSLQKHSLQKTQPTQYVTSSPAQPNYDIDSDIPLPSYLDQQLRSPSSKQPVSQTPSYLRFFERKALPLFLENGSSSFDSTIIDSNLSQSAYSQAASPPTHTPHYVVSSYSSNSSQNNKYMTPVIIEKSLHTSNRVGTTLRNQSVSASSNINGMNTGNIGMSNSGVYSSNNNNNNSNSSYSYERSYAQFKLEEILVTKSSKLVSRNETVNHTSNLLNQQIQPAASISTINSAVTAAAVAVTTSTPANASPQQTPQIINNIKHLMHRKHSVNPTVGNCSLDTSQYSQSITAFSTNSQSMNKGSNNNTSSNKEAAEAEAEEQISYGIDSYVDENRHFF